MANPRQRRKSRSGTAKVKLSSASRKNKNKVTLKAPLILQQNWDKTKTVRQNYTRLGLLPKLNPRQAGGIEPVEAVPYAIASAVDASLSDLEDADSDSDEEDEDDEEMVASTSAPLKAEPKKLAKGEGRIERDENGKIVRIVYGGDDGEEIREDVVERVRDDEEDEDEDEDEDEEKAEEEKKAPVEPWGKPMAQWDGERSDDELVEEVVGPVVPRSTGQGIPIGAPRVKVVAKTEVVRELEKLASRETKVIRHTSVLESDWLVDLVQKYGEDVDKMARDRKINPWQKTAGEIKRAVTKAGGFNKLKAKATATPTA